MISKVRGKFLVLGVEVQQHGSGRKIKFGAVSVSDNEKSENNMYHKYTPSGEITMYVDNPSAEEFFVLGDTVYVDFTKAPKE
jgi:hypothetical protein